MVDAKRLLGEYGLTRNETQIYLVSLKLGPSRAFNIAKAARLPESTTRDNLGALLKKGLLVKSYKKDLPYFISASPQKLAWSLNKKIADLKQLQLQLRTLKISAGK